MNNKINYQKMDGKTCGFGAVHFPQNSENEEFIRDKDGNIKLFKNMGLLKSWMNNVVHENNPFMYEIFIKPKFEDFLIPFDEVQFLNGVYEWYSDNGILFMFKESKVVKTLDLGYFVFEKNPSKEISKEEGKDKAKKLYKAARIALQQLVSFPNAPYAIEAIGVDSFGNVTGRLKGSTGEIHICKNIKLIEMNMNRKKERVRCLPFISDLDKFSSLYIFTTKDLSDPNSFDHQKKLELVRDVLLDILQQYYPEISYVPVSYHGTIVVEGGEKKNGKNYQN